MLCCVLLGPHKHKGIVMKGQLEYRAKAAKTYHQQEMDRYREDIKSFREENEGRHERCDYLAFRKEMLIGHRMAWNALNDLLRG